VTDLLLDTHVLLWWLEEPGLLTAEAREAIFDQDSDVYVSVASAWEMGIKSALGKLSVPDNLPEVLGANEFEVLDVRLPHAMAVRDLPVVHGDPFDRLLIAQARIEGLTIVTRDPRIGEYDVAVLTA
jgi:PIN domain nuclease of toxin-antitoxin system